MADLWSSANAGAWRQALERYDDVVEAQGVKRLPDLDRWYRQALPEAMAGREPKHVLLDELVRITEWKMARGVFRARNLVLVKGNDPDEVMKVSTAALAKVPHPTAPIADLAKLAGVGAATASGVASAAAPEVYPFFDELVAAQIPRLGDVAWTLAYYGRYAAAIRERAGRLGDDWTPVMVERALWAFSGGKKG